MEGLESEKTDTKEGALLWLLQRNNATNLSYFAFPKYSIRFGVDRVIKQQADAILWRLGRVSVRLPKRISKRHGIPVRVESGLFVRRFWPASGLD